MKDVLDLKQRKGLSRFLYNIATIMFGALVIGNFIFKLPSSNFLFVFGMFATLLLVTIALFLDKEGKGREDEDRN